MEGRTLQKFLKLSIEICRQIYSFDKFELSIDFNISITNKFIFVGNP